VRVSQKEKERKEREKDIYQDDKIGYDDKENEAYLNGLPFVKAVDKAKD
jgi:hypothetical protein